MPSPYYCITSYEPCNIGTCLTCRTSQPGTAYPYMTGAFVNNNVNLAAACFPDLPVHRCGEQVTVVTIQSACCSVPAGLQITVPIVDNGPASPCAPVTSPCSSFVNDHLIDLTTWSFSQLARLSLGLLPVLLYP
jgi:hypothetical protein